MQRNTHLLHQLFAALKQEKILFYLPLQHYNLQAQNMSAIREDKCILPHGLREIWVILFPSVKLYISCDGLSIHSKRFWCGVTLEALARQLLYQSPHCTRRTLLLLNCRQRSKSELKSRDSWGAGSCHATSHSRSCHSLPARCLLVEHSMVQKCNGALCKYSTTSYKMFKPSVILFVTFVYVPHHFDAL